MSQVAASNFPAGSDSPANLDDVQRAQASFIALLRDGKGLSAPVTLASAATTDIGGQNSPFVEISGTTGITSLGTNYNGPRFLRFTGILLLTHNATTLNLPGAANITTAAGDTAIAIPNQALNGWNVVSYDRASGGGLTGADEPVNAQTGTTYTYLTADKGKLVTHSNAAAIAGTLPQAGANFPAGWWMDVTNLGVGVLTITPTTSTIGGIASLILNGGKSARIVSDGTNYQLVGATPDSSLQLNTSNGYGSSSNCIRLFTNIAAQRGSYATDYTVSNSATLGTSITINTADYYNIHYFESNNAAAIQIFGISLNSSQLTTQFANINLADKLIPGAIDASTGYGSCAGRVYLPAGSVIRPHSNAAVGGVAAYAQLRISRG